MPGRFGKPCAHPSCCRLATPGLSRCDQHIVKREAGWDDRPGKGAPLPPTHEWERIRTRVFRRDNYLCQVCKAAGTLRSAEEVDHITPRTQGGGNDDGNLQSICKRCHRLKTQQDSNGGRGR